MAVIIKLDEWRPRRRPADPAPAPDPWATWLLLVAAQLDLTAGMLRLLAGGGRR